MTEPPPLVPARARLGGAAGGAGFALQRVGRQREKRAVGKFKIAAKDLNLALPAALSLDHELCADREAARKPA